ncbi:alcohol dehydrogenase catalytic domain-containing protein [Microbispora hainanensis]|uniref:Zinc-binding dehydrogenase n=1 Tax=Microbispora hainanensis TaxID=568844 RepID=A0A544Y2F8_9ACTN|nr:alcohol dehydrogenase catalytic domain-containing protein [Microbispora hainanensis]TQS10958.1 zinc-binding dehydrogenase [Microbispora hainanensis]
MRFSQVVAPGRSEVVEAPDAPLRPGAVRVRTLASGICVSELPAWAEHDGAAPRRLGHELSGEIVELGPGVHGWSRGDRVTGFASPAFADTVNVNARELLPAPSNVPSRAVLGEPLACVVEALSRCGLRPAQRVAVVGLGFMGLAALQVAADRAPARLAGVDPAPLARELAAELGASDVHTPEEAAESLRGTFDVVVEFSGKAAGLKLAGDLVTTHGTLCVAGYHHDGPRELDIELWYRGVTIVNGFTGQRWRLMAAMAEGLRMMADRRLTFEPLITHTVALEDVDTGFGYFRDRPDGFVKCVVTP